MVFRLWLIVCALFLASIPDIVLAQDQPDASEQRYIEELKQRNADYGPGCNGIGISTPREVNPPTDISTRWAAGHSACIPGMRLVLACIGEVENENRIIGCTLQVADGQAAGAVACERLTLLAPDARFHPDPLLSDALSRGSVGASLSCSEPLDFSPGATIAVAFLVPAAESAGDLALIIDVNGEEVPAFLIPAGQLSVEVSSIP
jgi:hypothetical protein